MTQTEGVLELLKARPDGITPLDALEEVGTLRLAARISELRDQGHCIRTKMVRRGKARVALYTLLH